MSEEKDLLIFNNDDKNLCINCEYKNFESVNGSPKCYWRCPKKKTKTLDKF